MTVRKKLIEVALPLDAINAAAAREKSIRHGHPSTLHLWWARRPLAAARAVIFAQLVDDPSSRPELFPTEQEQDRERQRLFDLIEALVKWENTTNEEVLQQARDEIRACWRRACADHADHPRAAELFDPERLPAFHDPFAGGGALPLEAQRLGLEAHASDLNPVAVLINKAMIELPPKFAGRPPVHPEARSEGELLGAKWTGARGLAEDVRYYGRWMREEAERRIGHLYPKVAVTDEMVRERPDLQPYAGRELTVIAWLWARTVKSPNPAFAQMEVPLVSTFMLSTKQGKETYVEPVVGPDGYRFTVKVGAPPDAAAAKAGTKLARGANFRCLVSGVPIPPDYIRAEGMARRMGARLLAIVAEGDRGRTYVAPTVEHEAVALDACPDWTPDLEFFQQALGFRVGGYGMKTWGDLFTSRQLVALNTFADLLIEVRDRIEQDAIAAGLHGADTGASSYYAAAVSIYLGFALSKQADLGNSLCRWESIAQCPRHLFGRQAIPMFWDYAEGNPLGDSSGGWMVFVDGIVKSFAKAFERVAASASGLVQQADAGTQSISRNKVVSTDPPYYDNIGYADLSDFFYIWLRRSLRSAFPDCFTMIAAPKTDELVATPARHGGTAEADLFFLSGMTQAMSRIADQSHRCFPVSIYYAFKQSETKTDAGVNTGWATFLDAVIKAGFSVTGTWPIRTENISRLRAMDSNALASSIVLVCRRRPDDAPLSTRRALMAALKEELPPALVHLQRGNVAPVDLAQAAIGPGMAIFTRYAKVLHGDGNRVTVREALALINQTLDEILTAQEGDFDTDSRWALAWFDQHGFEAGEYGSAETLATAKNTSVSGMVQAGIIHSQAGSVRLLRPQELPADWDPAADDRLTTWEAVHHLIRVVWQGGEMAAARLLRRLGGVAGHARELCYRLYTVSERRKRAAEALDYNGLVKSWPEISRLAVTEARLRQTELALNADPGDPGN